MLRSSLRRRNPRPASGPCNRTCLSSSRPSSTVPSPLGVTTVFRTLAAMRAGPPPLHGYGAGPVPEADTGSFSEAVEAPRVARPVRKRRSGLLIGIVLAGGLGLLLLVRSLSSRGDAASPNRPSLVRGEPTSAAAKEPRVTPPCLASCRLRPRRPLSVRHPHQRHSHPTQENAAPAEAPAPLAGPRATHRKATSGAGRRRHLDRDSTVTESSLGE